MSRSHKTYSYKTHRNDKILADVFPVPNSNELSPTVIWIHGGGLIFGSRRRIHPEQLKRYLALGCTVVSIDYRLAPETKLPSIIRDIEDAYHWVRESGQKLFHADPERLALIGHSAGGYLGLLTACHLFPKPKALVSFYGYGDITGDWCCNPDPFYNQQPSVTEERAYAVVGQKTITQGKEERNLFYLYCRQRGVWSKEVSGFDPVLEASAFPSLCPIHNISHDFPSTLLLHGKRDKDVPCQQSTLMSKILSGAGVENELIIVPEEGHLFDRYMSIPSIANIFDSVLAFLRKHLLNRS